jgi:hypothetical protein
MSASFVGAEHAIEPFSVEAPPALSEEVENAHLRSDLSAAIIVSRRIER